MWTNSIFWALVIGAVSPPLIAIFNQPSWPGWARQAVTWGIAGVIGLLVCLANGDLANAKTVPAAIGVSVAAAHVAYKTIMSKIATAVETATSPTDSVVAESWDLRGEPDDDYPDADVDVDETDPDVPAQ